MVLTEESECVDEMSGKLLLMRVDITYLGQGLKKKKKHKQRTVDPGT